MAVSVRAGAPCYISLIVCSFVRSFQKRGTYSAGLVAAVCLARLGRDRPATSAHAPPPRLCPGQSLLKVSHSGLKGEAVHVSKASECTRFNILVFVNLSTLSCSLYTRTRSFLCYLVCSVPLLSVLLFSSVQFFFFISGFCFIFSFLFPLVHVRLVCYLLGQL